MLPCILCTCTIDVLVSKFSCDLLLRDSVISNGTFFHKQDNDQNLDLYLPIPAYWPLLSRGNLANAVPNPEKKGQKRLLELTLKNVDFVVKSNLNLMKFVMPHTTKSEAINFLRFFGS